MKDCEVNPVSVSSASLPVQPGAVEGRGVDPVVEESLRAHVEEFFSGERLAGLAERFAAEHVVAVRGVCPPELFPGMRDEAFSIMDRFGVARDLVLEITDGTPRHMTTVGQPVIKEHGR